MAYLNRALGFGSPHNDVVLGDLAKYFGGTYESLAPDARGLLLPRGVKLTKRRAFELGFFGALSLSQTAHAAGLDGFNYTDPSAIGYNGDGSLAPAIGLEGAYFDLNGLPLTGDMPFMQNVFGAEAKLTFGQNVCAPDGTNCSSLGTADYSGNISVKNILGGAEVSGGLKLPTGVSYSFEGKGALNETSGVFSASGKVLTPEGLNAGNFSLRPLENGVGFKVDLSTPEGNFSFDDVCILKPDGGILCNGSGRMDGANFTLNHDCRPVQNIVGEPSFLCCDEILNVSPDGFDGNVSQEREFCIKNLWASP
ncbi:MAG: hypothetical protein JW727_00515 [Candidatus Aenigmarchaeota archaeon]|nr:hypothetical protein [Candidatus Aenigmarchaeota archaeon]